MKRCELCNKPHKGTYGSGRFCGSHCARSFATKKKRKIINRKVSITLRGPNYIKRYDCCQNCGKEFEGRKRIYCNSQCQYEYKTRLYLQQWKNGKIDGLICGGIGISKYIRHYLWKKYKGKCSRCGWDTPNPYTKHVILEVEHINGNSTDNREENLDLICPNCHSLTSTYKALNSGHRLCLLATNGIKITNIK